LPVSTKALVIVLLCIGFVIAIFLSWVYDITPSGVKKTKPVSAVKDIGINKQAVSRGWKIATYVSGAIIIALLAFNFISRRSLDKDISKLEKSIAVLPFINDSPSDSTTYFVNGIMDDILNNLQKIKAFSKVLPRTSVEQYRGSVKPTILKIAKDLDVNYIVTGSGQKYGNSYRVRVQLNVGKNDKQLWGDSYEREIRGTKDIYRTQSEIAQSIASALKATITPEEKHLIEKTPTRDLTALDFYQRGRDELTKYWIDNDNKAVLGKASNFYNKALEYDSTFAQAYTGLAWVYWGINYSEEYFSKNFLDSVLVLANLALSFDDQLAEAHYVRGRYYYEKGYIKKAIEEYDKTIKLNPNDWESYFGIGKLYAYDDNLKSIENLQKAASLNHSSELPGILREISFALAGSGFNDQAKRYNLEALKLDDDSIKYYICLETIEYFSGNYENAIEFLKKAYAKDSTNQSILLDLGFNYAFAKQYKESLKYYKKYIERNKAPEPTNFNDTHRIGYSYWINGYKKEAEYYFDKQIEYCNGQIKLGRPWASQLFYTYYDLAALYAFRGDKDKAYDNIKIFNQAQRCPYVFVSFIKNDPLFDGIRNEPEFQKIESEVNFKAMAEHERIRKWLEETGQL
jgi:TolB-like protein/Flp pilus assembly protein TadD